MVMLKIALPNKGALSEESMHLVNEAGYRCKRYGRELAVWDQENDVEFIFLRPRDIAIYVANRTLDMGITGRDLVRDSGVSVAELLALGIGKSTFRFAVPKGSGLVPEKLHGLRIATSYATLVRDYLSANGLDATVVKLDGAVEISIQLGVADAIADVVESGRTLNEVGLETIGAPLLLSEAIVISADPKTAQEKPARIFIERLKGVITARNFVLIEYDCPKAKLEEACTLTPGIESPTISPLNDPDWVAVKAMVERKSMHSRMDALAEMGAKGILVSPISICRI
jgi:ATP phosphoribosyltransferase